MNGDRQRSTAEVEAIAEDDAVPASLREVAVSWRLIARGQRGGCITDAVQRCDVWRSSKREAGLHYFAGVTLHNTAYAELARGNYARGARARQEAIGHFERADGRLRHHRHRRAPSEQLRLAELGDLEEGLRLATASATEPGCHSRRNRRCRVPARGLWPTEPERGPSSRSSTEVMRGGSRDLGSSARAGYAQVRPPPERGKPGRGQRRSKPSAEPRAARLRCAVADCGARSHPGVSSRGVR